MHRITTIAALGAATGLAGAQTYDFDTIAHGEIVDTQFAPSLTISGSNPNRSFDIVAGFDTNRTGTADPDLESPFAGGNIMNLDMGTVLILAENNTGAGDGVLDNPDDEASRPVAGSITFSFAAALEQFAFDIIDIEGVVERNSSLDFFSEGSLVGSVSFTEFTDNTSAFYNSSVVFGNNFANRIAPITSAQLGSTFDTVVLNAGGSLAIDRIDAVEFEIPAPGSLALLGFGIGVASRRRR